MAGSYPERLLIHRVTIQRTTGSSVDTRGLDSDVWSDVSTNVPARLVFINETESRDGRNTVVQNWTAYFTGSVTLKASDRIYWNSENKYFEINSVNKTFNRVGRLFSVQADLLFFE
tara:strand:- start:90 stop:437 length:348 start_codon:yes stop_codon:yes gene_type:complete